jgi:hypothetical protein
MSLQQCMKIAEQMDVNGITFEKLEIADVVRKAEEVIIATNSATITYLGSIVKNGEERKEFADGNSKYELAEISAKTFWEWKGKLYVAEMVRSYSCAGHCIEQRFAWNKFDNQIWSKPQRIAYISSARYAVTMLLENDIDEIILFVSYALTSSKHDTDPLSIQDIPQLSKQLLAICPISKIKE